MVTRAPGRLDVMGGIADYSGSLVLQMPLAEACHVAAQLQKAPSSECSLSAIRVVSFNNSGSTDRRVVRPINYINESKTVDRGIAAQQPANLPCSGNALHSATR